MRVLGTALFALAVLVGLVGAASADTTVSQSNDPGAGVGLRLSRLLGQERTAFSGIGLAHLEKISTPPPRPGRRASEVRYDAGWIDSLPAASGDEQWACLAEALYFEARGESVKGQFAVGEVIMNRVRSSRFPDSICAVVNQGTGRRYACQFSFTCDGRPEVIDDAEAYGRAGKIAALLLGGAKSAVTDGATYFHTVHVNPTWSGKFSQTVQIGAHLFYRPVPTTTVLAAN